MIFLKILCIGDLHGHWPKKLNKTYIKKNKIDLILVNGDLGKDLTSHFYTVYKKGEKRPIREVVGNKKWEKLIKKEAESSAKILMKFDKLGPEVLFVYGNGDSSKKAWYLKNSDDPKFEDYLGKLNNVAYLEYTSRKINGYTFFGVGNKFTRLIKQKVYEKIRKNHKKKLNDFFKKKPKNVILLTHETPYMVFDKVLYRHSFRYGMRIGDDILRKMILKYKPIASVFGHMHEYWGAKKLGKTLCINCGYGMKGKAVILNLETKKIRRVRLN